MYLNRADKTAFQDSANNNFASLLRQEEMPATVWGADFQTTLALGDTTGLTLGAAYKRASWDYDDIYVASTREVGADGSQQFVSPFANLDLRFMEERVIVNIGARYDWVETSDGANWDTTGSAGKPAYDNTFDSSSEGSFSPKAGITWHLDDKTTVRASGGKGFRYTNPEIVNLSVTANYYGDIYFDNENTLNENGYFTVDASVSRKLVDHVTAFVNAENIF